MKQEYDYVNYPTAPNGKYINGYILKEDVCELHIADGSEIDIRILIDLEDYLWVRGHFWTFTMTGRDKNCLCVYSYAHGGRIYLKQFILNEKKYAIVTLNRDASDMRKENLARGVAVYGTGKRKSLKGNSSGENSISVVLKKDGSIQGYKLTHRENGKPKSIYFGIKEYGSAEACLERAVVIRNQLSGDAA